MHGSLDAEQRRAVDERVRAHLVEILDSSEFTGSERRRDLLRYLVEESIAGRAGDLKARTIAVEVFGRGEDFDPQVDPIVRVEVGRLRANLDRFYRHHPRSAVVLEIPKGQHGVRALPQREPSAPRVAVLPFDLSVGDSDLAAGFLCLDSRMGSEVASRTGLPVIADIEPDSDRPDSAALAAMLGATFLLSGSIRTSGSHLRADFALFDEVADDEVWSESFDLETSGMSAFVVEDWLVERVCGRVSDGFGLINRRVADHPPSIGGQPQQAAAQVNEAYRSPTAQSLRAVTAVATDLEADTASHLASLSDAAFTAWWLGLDDSLGGPEAASELAIRSVALNPDSVEANMALAYSLFGQGDAAGFDTAIQRALDLAGPYPQTLAASGVMISLAGDLRRGTDLCQRAIDLNPYVPHWWRVVPALAAMKSGRYEQSWVEALGIGRSGAYIGPALRVAAAGLAGSQARPGDLQDLLEWQPEFPSRGLELTARFFLDDALRTRVEKGLAAAGLDLR